MLSRVLVGGVGYSSYLNSVRQSKSHERRSLSSNVEQQRGKRTVCGSYGSEDSIWSQKKKLEQLFYSSSDTKPLADDTELLPSARPLSPVILHDLPLWRVQWAMFPGLQEVLHCHVPHYCHMFESILAGPRPWCFGHVYLPGGSSNLSHPDFILEEGSQAALTGVLMHIKKAVRLKDGRLIILAQGVARIRVVQALQLSPYSRAHCMILPDIEEKELVQMLAVESASNAVSDELSVGELMDYVDLVATAAAATATQSWIEWEVACRGVDWTEVLEPATERESLRTAQLVAEEGSVDVVPQLPPDLVCLGGHSRECGSSGGLRQQLDEVNQSLLDATRLTANRVAAAAFIEHMHTAGGQSDSSSHHGESEDDISGEQLIHFLQSVEQNIAALENMAKPDAEGGNFPVSEDDEAVLGDLLEGIEGPAALLALELRVWEELDELCVLAARLSPTAMQLPEGLLRLRPVSNEFGNQNLFSYAREDGDNPSAESGDPSRSPGSPEDTSSSSIAQLAADAAVRPSSPDITTNSRPHGSQPRDSAGDSKAGVSTSGDAQQKKDAEEVASWNLPEALLLRRAQRLSYVMSTVLADVSGKEGWQSLLELPSVASRLRVIIVGLRRHRKVLAAVAALQSLGQDDETTEL